MSVHLGLMADSLVDKFSGNLSAADESNSTISTMYIEILGVILLTVCLSYWWNVRQFSKKNLPFSWPIPLVGNNIKQLFGKTRLYQHVQNTYNKFQGHPYAGMFEFTSRMIMIRDPEVIKLITVKDFDHFTDRRNTIPEDVEPMVTRNLLGLKGETWKTARTTLSPSFTSSKMKFMYQLVSECGRQLTRHIDKELQRQGCGVVKLDMTDVYTRYTNDVIATTAYGIKCNSLEEKDNHFYIMGRKLTNFSTLRILGCAAAPSIFKLFKISILPEDCTSYFKQLIFDTIREREDKNIVRPDMIHMLLEAKKAQNDITNDDIAAQAFVFFIGGFLTSSTLLGFSTLLLAMHPDIQKKVQEEIDKVYNDEEQSISYEAIHELPYLDMVIAETLRLYPPNIDIDRRCVKTYTVPAAKNRPELKIEKGETVWIPIYALHRDPDYFPDPDSFQPERFSEENKHNIIPCTYIPFGVGPRNCIGKRLGLMEVKVALVHLLSRFNFQVIDKTPLPIKINKVMNIVGGFWIGLTSRSK